MKRRLYVDRSKFVNLVLHECGTIFKTESDSRQKIDEKTSGRGKEALNTFLRTIKGDNIVK